jgi:hypothetical protein
MMDFGERGLEGQLVLILGVWGVGDYMPQLN